MADGSAWNSQEEYGVEHWFKRMRVIDGKQECAWDPGDFDRLLDLIGAPSEYKMSDKQERRNMFFPDLAVSVEQNAKQMEQTIVESHHVLPEQQQPRAEQEQFPSTITGVEFKQTLLKRKQKSLKAEQKQVSSANVHAAESHSASASWDDEQWGSHLQSRFERLRKEICPLRENTELLQDDSWVQTCFFPEVERKRRKMDEDYFPFQKQIKEDRLLRERERTSRAQLEKEEEDRLHLEELQKELQREREHRSQAQLVEKHSLVEGNRLGFWSLSLKQSQPLDSQAPEPVSTIGRESPELPLEESRPSSGDRMRSSLPVDKTCGAFGPCGGSGELVEVAAEGPRLAPGLEFLCRNSSPLLGSGQQPGPPVQKPSGINEGVAIFAVVQASTVEVVDEPAAEERVIEAEVSEPVMAVTSPWIEKPEAGALPMFADKCESGTVVEDAGQNKDVHSQTVKAAEQDEEVLHRLEDDGSVEPANDDRSKRLLEMTSDAALLAEDCVAVKGRDNSLGGSSRTPEVAGFRPHGMEAQLLAVLAAGDKAINFRSPSTSDFKLQQSARSPGQRFPPPTTVRKSRFASSPVRPTSSQPSRDDCDGNGSTSAIQSPAQVAEVAAFKPQREPPEDLFDFLASPIVPADVLARALAAENNFRGPRPIPETVRRHTVQWVGPEALQADNRGGERGGLEGNEEEAQKGRALAESPPLAGGSAESEAAEAGPSIRGGATAADGEELGPRRLPFESPVGTSGFAPAQRDEGGSAQAQNDARGKAAEEDDDDLEDHDFGFDDSDLGSPPPLTEGSRPLDEATTPLSQARGGNSPDAAVAEAGHPGLPTQGRGGEPSCHSPGGAPLSPGDVAPDHSVGNGDRSTGGSEEGVHVQSHLRHEEADGGSGGEAEVSRPKKERKRPLFRGEMKSRKSLQGAGTEWVEGTRRSTRTKCKPLQYWRGERQVLERNNKSCLSVTDVILRSPDPMWPAPAAHFNMKKPQRKKVKR